jgi:hypothetical protein
MRGKALLYSYVVKGSCCLLICRLVDFTQIFILRGEWDAMSGQLLFNRDLVVLRDDLTWLGLAKLT